MSKRPETPSESVAAAPEVDIPKPSRQDEAFRRSEARYRALVEATTQVVWSWTPHDDPSDLEPAQHWWEQLTGQSVAAQRADADCWLEFVHPDDRDAAKAAWANARSTGGIYDTEYRVLGRDGDVHHVRSRGIPVRDPDGSVREWVGTLDNVTIQRRAAAERDRLLAESERQRRMYETALANTADSVYLFDLDGRFRYVNKTLFGGKTQADVCGRNFHELGYPPELATKLERQIQQVVATGRPLRDDTPDTASRFYEYIFIPVFGADGKVEAVAGSTRDITDRKRSEVDLRWREERHRALLSATSDVVYRMSADWSEMQPMDGRELVSSNAAPTRDWLHRNIPPFEQKSVKAAVERAIAEKGLFELEHQVIRADGSLGWTHSRAVPILDEVGEITEWFGLARDITRRKQAETDLHDIRSRMEAALAAGAIGTWSWDVQADRFYGDASVARIFAVEPKDVAGGPLVRLVETIHPDDRSRVEELVRRAVRSGDRYEADYRVAQRDGSWKWVTARGQVECDSEGQAVRFPGVIIDITDWKRAEEDLARLTRDSDHRRRVYETILSNTPDFAYVFNLDHLVTYANETLLRMWGLTWDEAIGKTFLEIGYEPWHAEMHNREIDTVKATRQPLRGEVPFNGTFGRRIYDYIFVPVFGAGGEVEAVAGTTRDVTDRKEAEVALREADRKKDDFLALLAHELRNPLAPIRNGLQVMRLAEGDPTVTAEAREMMDRQLSHMVRLIDDLLDVSRITRNKLELRRNRVTLKDVVNNAVEAAGPLVHEAGHELSLMLPSEKVVLDADLTRLAQVFSNLLTNSAKYTPRGGKIWLSAEVAGDTVVVSVRDTGIGIPAVYLPKIFDMFSQVDRSIERSTGGLGIGLALVRGLVEMHGGTVTAESVEGSGSTFTVRLPIAVVRAEAGAPASQVQSSTADRLRVLVVDDNRDGAESMAMMLRLLGNEVTTVHDGLEAVAAAGAFRPEIILMDIGLPRLNGLDATRRIREQDWGRDMTIIALTGWGQDNDRERSRDAGCNDHLVKPVEFANLQSLLKKFSAR